MLDADSLGNMPKTKLIDGFLRQLWQEQHEHLLPTKDMSNFLEKLAKQEPAHGSWHMDLGSKELRPCLEKSVRTMLQLSIFTQCSDPPLTLRANLIGSEQKFNAKLHVAMDGSIKAGKPCVIVFPPLLSGCAAAALTHPPKRSRCSRVHRICFDGSNTPHDIKAKAQVLAANYEL